MIGPQISRADALDPGKTVEPAVEAQDPIDSLPLHDGEMEGIASREALVPEHDRLRALDDRKIDRKDLVRYRKENVEGGLDRIPSVDRDEPVEDLLKDFGVRDQPLLLRDAPLEKPLGILLVRMGRSDEVHGDVRIDEDQLLTALEVATLDLLEHPLDIRRGKGMPRRRPDGVQLLSGVGRRLPAPRLAKGLADPFRNRHSLRPGRALDRTKLGLIKDDLETLTHGRSVFYSRLEYDGESSSRTPKPRPSRRVWIMELTGQF